MTLTPSTETPAVQCSADYKYMPILAFQNFGRDVVDPPRLTDIEPGPGFRLGEPKIKCGRVVRRGDGCGGATSEEVKLVALLLCLCKASAG